MGSLSGIVLSRLPLTWNNFGILLPLAILGLVGVIAINILRQVFFVDLSKPPIVFHWLPLVGSTISYGMDPYKFFSFCREKYGDCFTFILFGKKTTVFLGPKGNNFILNGKVTDLNAEEIYGPITTPVFGPGVVFDCPNAMLMEQKKMIKFGLTTASFQSYASLMFSEVESYINRSSALQGQFGTINVPAVMAEITLYTAACSLQGVEVRNHFDSSFVKLFLDLDGGFTLINFFLPRVPFPHNRRRDYAQRKVTQTYIEIMQARRKAGTKDGSKDMIWNLMDRKYKDGTPLSDRDIACMMIAMLIAGQHSASATSAWIMTRLATRPDLIEALYQEQISVLGPDLPPLTLDNLGRLQLNSHVVKETLRLHAPIHSIMRMVKNPMPIPNTQYTVPVGHILLAAPGTMCRDAEYFPDPMEWNPYRWDAGMEQKLRLEDDKEEIDYGYGMVSKGASSPYLPFGAGRHRCIAEQFAYMQLGVITATMVRNFKWTSSGKAAKRNDPSLSSKPMQLGNIDWTRRS